MKFTTDARLEKYKLQSFQLTLWFSNPGLMVDFQGSLLHWLTPAVDRWIDIEKPDDNMELANLLSEVAIVGETVTVSIEDSLLTLTLGQESVQIQVPPSADYEAWEVHFIPALDDGTELVICMPGGRLGIYGSPR